MIPRYVQENAGRLEYKGNPASPGVVIGEAFVIPTARETVPRSVIGSNRVRKEIAKFKKALKKTKKQVLASQSAITKKLGRESGRIFDAHILILEDQLAIDQTVGYIQDEKVNAEYAFFRTISNYLAKMREVDDEYLREREADIRDVQRRVIMNIMGMSEDSIPRLKNRVILIARELTPSQTAGLSRKKVIGVATDVSGKTTHAVLFARSLEIPAVIGLQRITQQVRTGDTVILDGISGTVIANPNEQEIEHYNEKVRQFREFEEELHLLNDLPAMTVDGHDVQLSANLEIPDEVGSVIGHGAKGVGLFRTEFLFFDKVREPDEEEQYQIYRDVVRKIAPDSVIIRTFDIGGDKYTRFFGSQNEKNPYLGWRAIRISLDRESLFRKQLRAILRSSVEGNLKLMFPMVTCREELDRALEIVREEEQGLTEKGIPFDPTYEKGVMIETPAAALISPILARKVDFFSVGTNDLIQYTMAVDRDNPKVSRLYQTFHPGVIQLVKTTVEAAKEAGIWVGVCGEMAGNPLGAALLLGLGVDELSVSPILVPEVKTMIRSLTIAQARDVAARVLEAETQEEALAILKEALGDRLSELFLT